MCAPGSGPITSGCGRRSSGYGGTVEKFVGDAVMAVFGAPVAHEDDAERAVRAGLRILEAIGELNEADPGLSLQVRVGINTGEAVVALDARPEQGEGFVTGDVVNTASRLQGAAPVDGIAVSEQTYRRRSGCSTTSRWSRCPVKGKAEPLALWRPLAGACAVRLGRDPHAHDAAGRPGAGEAAADRDLRALGAAALLPAGHGRRRAGRGQEPPLRGALRLHRGAARPRPLAAGPLPALRGGHRLLGAGRDRQGRVRHPRVRLARARQRPSSSAPCPQTTPTCPG